MGALDGGFWMAARLDMVEMMTGLQLQYIRDGWARNWPDALILSVHVISATIGLLHDPFECGLA
jgi:hypothetical protein